MNALTILGKNIQTTLDCQTIRLEMTQMRSGVIRWNIPSEHLKRISEYLKRFYPVWRISVRSLDIHSWALIWDIMGDLIRCVPNNNQIKELDVALEKVYEKYGAVKDEIDHILSEEEISVDQYGYVKKFSDILKMRLGGDKFTIHDKNLKYYSDGTNSFEYLRLLLALIPLISKHSMKFPIIMIDEPEIGLHNALIADFVKDVRKNICYSKSTSPPAQLLLATHSSKLIEVLTSQEIQYELYRMSNHRLNTQMNRMDLMFLRKGTHTITQLETECFFSDYIVYVEGETEIQLFHNPYLQMLFPMLEKVHFYPALSNMQKYRNVNSRDLNLGIPYRLFMDMDKILAFNKGSSAGSCVFSNKTTEDLNPLNKPPKDRYDFVSNGHLPVNITTKKEIMRLLNKTYHTTNDYIADMDFEHMIDCIQRYCRAHNTLVNRWTIEGELITVENYTVFEGFLNACIKGELMQCDAVSSVKKKRNEVRQLMQMNDVAEKVALLVFCVGKSLNTRKVKSLAQEKLAGCSNPPTDLFGGKATKWVDLWMEYFFTKHLSVSLVDKLDDSKRSSMRTKFARCFPSLFANICEIEKMVRHE